MRGLFLALIFIPLVGCVSAIETAQLARTQSILVQTPYAEGASCKLTDARGRMWRVRSTPGNAIVEDGHSPLHIICEKKGYKTTAESITEKKEELLTIDGKRVDVSIYNQFPQKIPRLIPTAIKEASSFILDPTGQVSTEYPEEVTIWMEPLQWESEDAKIAWAYDRQISRRKNYLEVDYARAVEEERKRIRREKAAIRKEKYQELWVDTKEYAKKSVDMDTYMDAVRGTAAWGMDSTDKVAHGAVDSAGIALHGADKTTKGVVKKVGGMAVEAAERNDPRPTLKWLAEKAEEYNKEWNPVDSDWVGSNASKLKPSQWFPNWLKNSTVSKLDEKNDSKALPVDQNDMIEQRIRDLESAKPVGHIPPWDMETGIKVDNK